MDKLKQYNDAKTYLINEENINEYRLKKDGCSLPIWLCPDCSKYQFAKTQYGYYCFSCHKFFKDDDIDFCERCGKVICRQNDYTGLICEDCFEDLINRK